MTSYTILDSPLGELLVLGAGDAVTGLWTTPRGDLVAGARRDDGAFRAAAAQLDEYFAGERTAFDVRLAAAGTAFQRRLWAQLRRIPYGETTTYGQLAQRIGRPGCARAVGHANGRNPIAILVPCHRVIGRDGTLTGYAGGLRRKRALLELERAL